MCNYVVSQMFAMTSVRSPKNELFPTNLQIDLIGNNNCQIICSFWEVLNMTLAKRWHCELCHRTLVTNTGKNSAPIIYHVMWFQILVCKISMLCGSTFPMSSSPSCYVLFCFILSSIWEISPQKITIQWTGNQFKTENSGLFQIVQWKLSCVGAEAVWKFSVSWEQG